MKRQRDELVLTHNNNQIFKCFDCWGNWNYVLMVDGQFITRDWNFEKLKQQVYRQLNTDFINGKEYCNVGLC